MHNFNDMTCVVKNTLFCLGEMRDILSEIEVG
jgi:hypothetical protein